MKRLKMDLNEPVCRFSGPAHFLSEQEIAQSFCHFPELSWHGFGISFKLHFVPSGSTESLSQSHCDNRESHSSDKEIIARIKKKMLREATIVYSHYVAFKPKYFGH